MTIQEYYETRARGKCLVKIANHGQIIVAPQLIFEKDKVIGIIINNQPIPEQLVDIEDLK